MTNKVIRNIDDKTWNTYVGICKINNIKVGTQLNILIQKYITDSGYKIHNPTKK